MTESLKQSRLVDLRDVGSLPRIPPGLPNLGD